MPSSVMMPDVTIADVCAAGFSFIRQGAEITSRRWHVAISPTSAGIGRACMHSQQEERPTRDALALWKN